MSDWEILRDRLGLTLRPIDPVTGWPGKLTYNRKISPYSAPLKDTLAVLQRELRELGATAIVLQIAIPERGLRLDGLPRAGATAEHPGVVLSFDSKRGPLRLHFDGFTRWTENLRAIAMHLEHLRKASLYGVGADGQQYRGWQALPETTSAQEGGEALLRRMAEVGGWRRTDGPLSGVDREAMVRAARRAAHPDCATGSHEMFLAVKQAAAALGL